MLAPRRPPFVAAAVLSVPLFTCDPCGTRTGCSAASCQPVAVALGLDCLALIPVRGTPSARRPNHHLHREIRGPRTAFQPPIRAPRPRSAVPSPPLPLLWPASPREPAGLLAVLPGLAPPSPPPSFCLPPSCLCSPASLFDHCLSFALPRASRWALSGAPVFSHPSLSFLLPSLRPAFSPSLFYQHLVSLLHHLVLSCAD